MNKKKIICPECRTYTGYIIRKEKRKYIIRDQEYYFDITVAYCEKCGEEIEVPGLLDLQMKEVDEQYRKKENIVFIDEIEKLMTLYDIGKAPLSLGLGFGEITITRYLKGQVPSKEYSDIIKNALESPKYMLYKLIENKNKIAANAFEKAEKCALNLEKMFNISSKMLSTISYIFEESLEITPLALQKILYFIQGIYLALYDVPLFDEECYAWAHGPVYNSVYNLFKEFKYNPIDDDRFMILKNRFEELTEQERNVIQLVLNSFGNYSGKVLEEITHQEDPWINSRNGYSFLEPSNNLIEKNQIQLYFKKIDKEYSLRNIKEINRYINEQLELKNK